MLHQVGDLFELNVKLRCQKVKASCAGREDKNHTRLKRLKRNNQHNKR